MEQTWNFAEGTVGGSQYVPPPERDRGEHGIEGPEPRSLVDLEPSSEIVLIDCNERRQT